MTFTLPTPAPGSFLAAVGLVPEPFEPAGMDTVVRGTMTVDERHHTPWGVVHGGVWTTAVESAASIGASAVVEANGQFAVGVDNLTDFVRPLRTGTVSVVARPVQIGRMLQTWSVEIRTVDTDKLVAIGRLRLANQDLPAD